MLARSSRSPASDGLYELNLPYPTRKISRTCWKAFNSQACPYADHGAMDLVHFPDAAANSCDKNYDTPNGCLAHGMKRYYGGIIAVPQGVRIKDNSTGVWGFGRSMLTSVSLVADSIYDQVLAGGVHGHRDAGQLQGRGGPGRERLLRGVGHRGRRPARGVHADPLRGQGRRRQRRDAGGPHARRAGAPRLPQERPTASGRCWAPIRPARATSSRSTNPAT